MKTSINDLNEIARSRGGICLGPSLKDHHKKKYIWKCENGHTWEAAAYSVINGTWCPICYRSKPKITIDEMKEIAGKRGGECLSDNYINFNTRLTWKCINGHIFEATPTKVKKGRWCRICGNRNAAFIRRTSINKIKMLAISRKGICLSVEYNPKEKLKWQCEFGHIWIAGYHAIKKGSWCPTCGHLKGGKKPLSIKEMHIIAESRGGKCLSSKYTNVESKLRWMCKKGHVWVAIPSAIKKGSWCPECAGNKMLDLEQIKEVARERGGKCLSSSYKGNQEKLNWECAEGHTWLAKYSNISIGRWCPECSSGIGERICRAFFEQIFDKKFPKTRLSWLINQDGYQMELDGYCQDLALAFEHQGQQHFRQIDYFHTSDEQHHKRQFDDRRKKLLCQQNNVKLIEVPQIPDYLHLDQVQEYIIKKCMEMGIDIPNNAENIKVKLLKAYTPSGRIKIQQINEIASKHNGICLSKTYAGNTVKLRFKCEYGHEWETVPPVILKGHWCKKCNLKKAGLRRRQTIESLNLLAIERGGRCVSETYEGVKVNLLWECSEGHQWMTAPGNIKQGTWCPKCGNMKKGDLRKSTISEMNLIANDRGGKCLSLTYKDSKSKLLWECSKGHQWMTTPGTIKRGKWCPKCSAEKNGILKRLKIEDMRQIAEERGGHCLSGTYVNSGEMLLWECGKGHQWMSTPDRIKRGSWCKICSKEKRKDEQVFLGEVF